MNNTNKHMELIARQNAMTGIMASYGLDGCAALLIESADMLEADALELTRLRELARDAADAATQLQKQVLVLKAQQVTLPVWKAERTDEYEIRVTSPEGESWRLRSADRNDSFNNFIWHWAESMVNKGDLNAS